MKNRNYNITPSPNLSQSSEPRSNSSFGEHLSSSEPLLFPTLLDDNHQLYNKFGGGGAMEEGYFGDYTTTILEPKEFVKDFYDFSHLPPLGNGDIIIEEFKVPSLNTQENNHQFNHEVSFKVEDMFGNNSQNQLQDNFKIGAWDFDPFIL